MKFKLGDKVRKPKGYNFEPAVIIMAGKDINNEDRYAAQISQGQCKGMIHIFNEDQLEHAD
jgi:hypothetical protein